MMNFMYDCIFNASDLVDKKECEIVKIPRSLDECKDLFERGTFLMHERWKKKNKVYAPDIDEIQKIYNKQTK